MYSENKQMRNNIQKEYKGQEFRDCSNGKIYNNLLLLTANLNSMGDYTFNWRMDKDDIKGAIYEVLREKEQEKIIEQDKKFNFQFGVAVGIGISFILWLLGQIRW